MWPQQNLDSGQIALIRPLSILNANKRMSVFDLQAATTVLGLAFFSSLILFIPCPLPEMVQGAQVRSSSPVVSVLASAGDKEE